MAHFASKPLPYPAKKSILSRSVDIPTNGWANDHHSLSWDGPKTEMIPPKNSINDPSKVDQTKPSPEFLVSYSPGRCCRRCSSCIWSLHACRTLRVMARGFPMAGYPKWRVYRRLYWKSRLHIWRFYRCLYMFILEHRVKKRRLCAIYPHIFRKPPYSWNNLKEKHTQDTSNHHLLSSHVPWHQTSKFVYYPSDF